MSTTFLARCTRVPLLALAALPLAAAPAAAQEPTGPTVGFVIEGALEMGGDRLATIGFEDGSEQDVRGGQGGTIAVGGLLRPGAESPLGLRGTVGFKYVTTKATNAHIRLTRVPVELVAVYDLPSDFWVGAGYVRHMAVRFAGDEIGPDVGFDDANGGTVELGWNWVALTYTGMRYTDEQGGEYDASSVGLSFSYVLGAR